MKKKPDEIVSQITQETDAEYHQRDLNDLVDVLDTVQGRRLFSRIIALTRWFDPPTIYGNKRDDIELGRRSIGGDIYTMVQELGLKGLDLIQLAQREYVATQIERQTLIDLRAKQAKKEEENT